MSQPLDADLPPTLNPSLLNQALTLLPPALELLARFHHRNKNQHRISKWWAQADMLRRHVRKMVEELEVGLEEAERWEKMRAKVRGKEKERLKARPGDKGRLRGKDGSGRVKGVGEEVQEGNEMVGKRAAYLRWKLGPGAFLAFTQLSADRQFAHLGLMLLGVLAQVDKAVAPFAPAPSDTSEEAAAAAAEEQAANRQRTKPGSSSAMEQATLTVPDQDTDMAMDVGLPVSREEILLSTEPAAETATSTPASALTPSHTPISTALPDRSSKEGRGISTSQPPAATVARTESEPASKDRSAAPGMEKPLKRKKKKRGGDEFGEIFGSLDDGESKKSKKKKTGGNEVDDIFGVAEKEGSSTSAAAAKPKANKKAGGDEFDDIFGSWGDSSKKQKKKKRKKGDEFDDIFGGL
ncbi:hypothetical protein VTI74DRAFT_1905 [Chaetomium olivicolor]